MKSLMFVALAPVPDHAAHLVHAGKGVTIQDLGVEGAVEALEVGVLGGLARLDVQQFDAYR